MAVVGAHHDAETERSEVCGVFVPVVQ